MQLRLPVFAAALVLLAYGQNTVVKVILAGKGWSLAGKDLTTQSIVHPGDQILGGSNESSDLLLSCGAPTGSVAYSCRKAPCEVLACRTSLSGVNVQPVDAVPKESSGSFFASLLRRDPAPVAILASRAAGNMNDAVVLQSGNDVHLAPALNRVLEGRYCFRFTPLPETNHSTIRTASMSWDRTADSEGLLSVTGLQPGLYAVEKSASEAEGACTFEPDAPRAWVLVSSDANFAHLNADWSEYRPKLAAMEKDNASPDVVRMTRHAILAHLADSAEGK